jgi:hypothetical protein
MWYRFWYSNYSTCEDVNECVEITFPVCSINSQCLNLVGGYDCICRFGLVWSNELKNCIDINECDIKVFKHQVCENNAICENSFGSYKCNCKNGWQNIDTLKSECKKRFNLWYNFSEWYWLFNELGFYTCTWRNGYTGSGVDKDCNDVNECLYDYIKLLFPILKKNKRAS